MSRLVRKQVYVTDEQERLLKQAARRERRSEAEILRSAVDRLLVPKKLAERRKGRDPLWAIVGLGRTNEGNVAQNVDRYLYGAKRR